MDTPVAFLIYRRPDLTARVFERIRAARPSRLLIVADGPKAGEEALCQSTRSVVAKVDWRCEVQKDFSESNLGCRARVSSGLDWVFSQVAEAIIVEDDCLPDPVFFPFCRELLAFYRDDARIGHIAGTDPCVGPRALGASYYFSRYTSIWGWATWRRAWQNYDVNMTAWPELKAEKKHYAMFGSSAEARHFEAVWDDIRAGEIDTWDGQWLLACRRRGLLAVVPNGNLVTNLGFRRDARHTVDPGHAFADLPARPIAFPLIHPKAVFPDDRADRERAEAEFLIKHAGFRRLLGKLGNRHFYGALLRRLPVIGGMWTAHRDAGRK